MKRITFLFLCLLIFSCQIIEKEEVEEIKKKKDKKETIVQTVQALPTKELLQDNNSRITFSAKYISGAYHLWYCFSNTCNYLVNTIYDNDCITPVFDRTGNIIYFSEYDGNDYELCSYNISTSACAQLTDNTSDDYCPVVSFDNTKIAWCRVPEMNITYANEAEIYYSDISSFSEVKLTDNNRMDAYPCFSYDNQYIVFESGDVDEYFGIWRVDLNGNEEALVYEPTVIGNGIPNVFASLVTFERGDTSGHYEVYMIDTNYPDELIKITHLFEGNNGYTSANPTPRFSNDGNKIAYHVGITNGMQTIVLNGDKKYTFGTTGNYFKTPRWNHNGNLIVLFDLQNKYLKVYNIATAQYENIGSSCICREQRFMEIYNFDIY